MGTATAGLLLGGGLTIFYAVAIVQPGHTTEEAITALIAELDRLKNEPITDRELQRTQKLVEIGAASRQELEKIHAEHAAQTAAVQSARSQLELLGVSASALENMAPGHSVSATTTVPAPIDGVVTERGANVGLNVDTATKLFTIVDPSSLRLEAQVPAEALQGLKVGTPVQFTVSGFRDERLTGRVTRIYPSVDPATRQVKILVTVPNPRQQLVVGLFAEGRVVASSRKGLTIPKAALDLKGVRPVVVQLDSGRLKHVEVALGLEDAVAELVEVTKGLASGDTIILGSSRGLPEGTPARVQVTAERSSASAAQ